MRACKTVFAVLALLGGACVVTVVGGTGGACSIDADCGPGYVCGFPEAAGCSAEGLCFVREYVLCQAHAPGCACDGTEINLACAGLPAEHASKPLAHAGACADGVPDAGACCPAGWLMYGCTFPDGGAGLACHNPALGCPSSLTCGEGCDAVVVGRCAGG
jgi:hypothetical protein